MNRTVCLSLTVAFILSSPIAIGSPTTLYVGVDLFTLEGAVLADLFDGHGGGPVGIGQAVGTSGSGTEAYLWTGPMGHVASLHPTTFASLSNSSALGTDGSHQVGYAYAPNQRAVLWSGTAASAIDLHPQQWGYLGSYAVGVGGGQQVGAGNAPDGSLRALLWNGSSDSVVDLQPTNLEGVEGSSAIATDVTEQVGFMNRWTSTSTLQGHAALWRGTADSAVDLHPLEWESLQGTQANGVGGGQQVGSGNYPGFGGTEFHAMLWSGTPESAVDLHPTHIADLYHSTAMDTDGLHQVGFISNKTNLYNRAVLWAGSAESIIDLHDLLPFEAVESFAYSVHDGNIYGIATDLMGNVRAVMWSPIFVPEPCTLTTALAGVLAAGATGRAMPAAG